MGRNCTATVVALGPAQGGACQRRAVGPARPEVDITATRGKIRTHVPLRMAFVHGNGCEPPAGPANLGNWPGLGRAILAKGKMAALRDLAQESLP